jgi:hypothetical protein
MNRTNGSPLFTNYLQRISDSTAAFTDAQGKYQEALKAFQSSEAVVGKKDVVSGGNVLKGVGAGAALGAGIGSFFGPVGTAIGAAAGAITGALVGLFTKKKKDIVAPLLATYPDLIKANGEFNDSLAQSLLDNNKIAESSKTTLTNLIAWKKAADEAKAQLKQIVSDLAGQLGGSLSTALENAFENGTNAAQAFGDTVTKILDDLISQLIFDKVFQTSLTKLGDDLQADLATGDNKKVIQDFSSFFSGYPDLLKQYNDLMNLAKNQASTAGMTMFATTAAQTGLSGGIQSQITEETGTELAGLMRKIADDNRNNRDYNKLSVDHLIGIENNTFQTVVQLQLALVELQNINKNTKAQYTMPI